jgi:hypothetical protein
VTLIRRLTIVIAALIAVAACSLARAQESRSQSQSQPQAQAQSQAQSQPQAQSQAKAQNPQPAATPFSFSLLVGYGKDLSDFFNRWGFGLGAQGGYRLDHLYLGARFVYHFGGSTSGTLVLDEPHANVSLWELTAQVGYEFALADRFTFRPDLLLGMTSFIVGTLTHSAGTVSWSQSELKPVISPGVSLLYDLTSNLFIGIEMRVPIVKLVDSIVGYVAYGSGGLRF